MQFLGKHAPLLQVSLSPHGGSHVGPCPPPPQLPSWQVIGGSQVSTRSTSPSVWQTNTLSPMQRVVSGVQASPSVPSVASAGSVLASPLPQAMSEASARLAVNSRAVSMVPLFIRSSVVLQS